MTDQELRTHITAMNLTAHQFADIVDMPRLTLWNYLHGRSKVPRWMPFLLKSTRLWLAVQQGLGQ